SCPIRRCRPSVRTSVHGWSDFGTTAPAEPGQTLEKHSSHDAPESTPPATGAHKVRSAAASVAGLTACCIGCQAVTTSAVATYAPQTRILPSPPWLSRGL